MQPELDAALKALILLAMMIAVDIAWLYAGAALTRLFRSIAAAHGATATLDYVRRYPPTVNHADEAAFAAEVAAEICGPDKVSTTTPPVMGAEDFSFMLNARPGAMLWLGNGPGEGGCYLHNPRYDFNDEALPIGASFFARLAERFMERRD